MKRRTPIAENATSSGAQRADKSAAKPKAAPSPRGRAVGHAVERKVKADTPNLLAGLRNPLARAGAQIMKLFFGGEPAKIFTKGRGEPKDAFYRQLLTYVIHVEGNLSEADTAFIMARDRSTVRHAARAFEDLRDDPDIDAALTEIGAAVVRLHAMGVAFEAASIECDAHTSRAGWLEALRAAGRAVRLLSEAAPEEAVTVTAAPDEAEALLSHSALRALLRGLHYVEGGAAPGDGPYIELGSNQDGKRVLRIITRAAKHVADDALRHGRAALIAAGMRIVMSDVMRAPKGGHVAYFKVANTRPKADAKKNASTNPQGAKRSHNSHPMAR